MRFAAVSVLVGVAAAQGAVAQTAGAQTAGAQAAGAPAAGAQSAEAQAPREQDRAVDHVIDAGDVVIVTGVGPARTSDELIASTTVLSADDISDRLGGGLGDTLDGLPGVSTTAFGPGASRPIIRGLGAERVQVLTNGIGVIDVSAVSPDHAVTGDPLGAERIEILRGPASLAYGGGATGGVINVIDGLIVERTPDTPVLAQGYAGYTSVDAGATLAARATGARGGWVGVLSGSYRDAGNLTIPGFAESAALRAEEAAAGFTGEEAESELENSFVESQALSGGLSYVGERGFIGGAVRRLETRYGVVGGHADGPPAGGAPVDEESPFIDMEQTRVDMRGGFRPGSGAFDRVTGAVSVVDYTHTEFEAPGVPGTVFNNTGFEARAEAEHVSVAGFKGSIGAQGSSRDFEAIGDEAFVTPTVTDQFGLFVFETYERGEWGLEGGLRVDRVSVDNAVFGARSFDTINASFGAHGHLLDDLFVGASLSRTERAPTDVELFANGAHLATQQFEVGDARLDTETGVSAEINARWEAGPLELGASVYRFAFNDFIYLSPTGVEQDGLPVFQAVQADATFTGAEATAALELGRALGASWRGDAAMDVVRAELDAGGDLPRIPPMSGSLGVEATWPAASARLEARWADEQDRVGALERPTEGWTTLDLRVNVVLTPEVDLILEGTNLTDEEVRVHASPLKDVAPLAGAGFRAAVRAKF